MRRLKTTIALLSTTALTVALVPSTIAATTASWPDEEWVNGTVGTSSFDCGLDEGYASTAFGQFLQGTLLGQDLAGIADVEGITLDQAADGTLDVDPPTAIDEGSVPPTATYTNPLSVAVLEDSDLLSLGLDLTGLSTNLPLGSAGAVNQFAQVSGYGNGAGASGLVSDSGAVGITPETPDTDLPGPATIALSNFIPPMAGVADVQLEVGAVAASSQLDWCAVLANEIWGVGPVTGAVRDYGLAGLGLELDSPLVAGLDTYVTGTALPAVTTALNGLLGPNGGIASAVDLTVGDLLAPGQEIASVTGNVTLSGLDLNTAVSSLLTTPLSDGVVTIDLASPDGTVSVDLDALLGYDATSLNGLDPNTELVIDDAVINALVTRIGTMLNTWVANIQQTVRTAIGAAVLTVDLAVDLELVTPAVPPFVPEIRVPLLTLDVDLVAPVSTILPPGATATFTIGIVAAGVPIPPILTTALNGLVTGLVAPVGQSVATVVDTAITTLGTTLGTVTAPIVTALSQLLFFLPAVVSLQANVQPDQPGGSGSSIAADPLTQSSAQYLVTALQLELVAAAGLPGGLSSLAFGTASVGPITAP